MRLTSGMQGHMRAGHFFNSNWFILQSAALPNVLLALCGKTQLFDLIVSIQRGGHDIDYIKFHEM